MPLTVESRHARLKARLERLIHVLLTHGKDRSESKEAFCQRCALDVEEIIDEIDHPPDREGSRPIGEVIPEVNARRERIIQRRAFRAMEEWG
jgi:hypothetical protein